MRKVINKASLVTMMALASCAFGLDRTDPGPPPSDYKQILKSYIHDNIFDPYSMRDVAVSNPVQGHLSTAYGWLVCLQTNARNPTEGYMGSYIGMRKTAYLIKNDVVVQHEDKSPFCDTQKLAPWPEMKNSGNGLKIHRTQ